MGEDDPAVVKLRRIRQLWAELGRTKPTALEYEQIMIEIRSLSAEYQALVGDSKEREK
jgi:hypothetical protein